MSCEFPLFKIVITIKSTPIESYSIKRNGMLTITINVGEYMLKPEIDNVIVIDNPLYNQHLLAYFFIQVTW